MDNILSNVTLMDAVYSLIGVIITIFIIPLIKRAGAFLVEKNEIAYFDKSIVKVFETLEACVKIVKQTMVDDLKASGNFTEEKQKEAFAKAYNMIMERLSEDARAFIIEQFGDLERFVTDYIDVFVADLKVPKATS